MQDECRILLLHGLLHLVGHDHELGPDEEDNMAQQEQQIMQNLGWKVSCLTASELASRPFVSDYAWSIFAIMTGMRRKLFFLL